MAALTARGTGGPVVVGAHGTFIARALVGYGVPGIDWRFCAAMPMPAVYRLRPDGEHVLITGPGFRSGRVFHVGVGRRLRAYDAGPAGTADA